MATTASHSATWGSYVFFVLMVFATDNAILPLSATFFTSASALPSPNQRSARSTGDLERLSTDEVATSTDGCSTDFVEKFFRVLSGPVGSEAEALVAAVLKLLSENDRVNWPAMADSDWLERLSAQSRDLFLSDKRQVQERGAQVEQVKRLAPKFNPTGWRRKRDTDMTRQHFRRYLRGVLSGLTAPRHAAPLMPTSPDQPDDVREVYFPGSAEWTDKKRDSLRRVLERLPEELKPKRKPLEFNPTGW